MYNFVRFGIGAVLGFILASAGIHLDNWRFWAIMLLTLLYGFVFDK